LCTGCGKTMESPVESIVRDISKEMSELLMKKVYVAIMDRIGQVYYADDDLDKHVEFCTNFLKNNFHVLDVGDHSIPLSNINLIFFKTSDNFATILFTREGRVGQLLAFKRKMESYGEKIEKALSEFVQDIEKIEKIEHEMYGKPPTIPKAEEESEELLVVEEEIEEVIEDYSEEFIIPEDILEPVEIGQPSDIAAMSAQLNDIPNLDGSGGTEATESATDLAEQILEDLTTEVESISATTPEPAQPQEVVQLVPEQPQEVVQPAAYATVEETTQVVEQTRVIPYLTRSLKKKDKFDIKTSVVIRFCDGNHTIDEIAQKADLPRSDVDFILDEWEKKGLIKLRVEHTRPKEGIPASYNLFPKIGEVALSIGFDIYEQAVLGLCDGHRTIDMIAQELNYDRNYVVSVIKKYQDSDWMTINFDGDAILYPINMKTIEPSAVQMGLISKKEFQIRELCDGNHSVEDISLQTGIKPKDINKILEKLKKKDIVKMKVLVQ